MTEQQYLDAVEKSGKYGMINSKIEKIDSVLKGLTRQSYLTIENRNGKSVTLDINDDVKTTLSTMLTSYKADLVAELEEL